MFTFQILCVTRVMNKVDSVKIIILNNILEQTF